MAFEESLYTILSGDAGVAAFAGEFIWPADIFQGSAWSAALTYTIIDGPREHAMNGPTGLIESRVLAKCWGKAGNGRQPYENAKGLARAVVAVLVPAGGFRQTVGGVKISGIFCNGEDDSNERPAGNIGIVKSVRLDFTIWHT